MVTSIREVVIICPELLGPPVGSLPQLAYHHDRGVAVRRQSFRARHGSGLVLQGLRVMEIIHGYTPMCPGEISRNVTVE